MKARVIAIAALMSLVSAAPACNHHYRVVTLGASAAEVAERIDAEAKAAEFEAGPVKDGAPRHYTRTTKRYDQATQSYEQSTERLFATLLERDGATRVVLESDSRDTTRAVLADQPAIEATDHVSGERDLYPSLRERFHFGLYFNYTIGRHPNDPGADNRYYLGGYVVLPVAEWGGEASLLPSHRRRLWVGVGGDYGFSLAGDPQKRGYLAVHFSHGDIRSFDGKTVVQSSMGYSYQLAVSMLRFEAPRRTEVMVVAPMAAMGVVAQVGWNWAGEREVAWSVGVRIPIPLSVGLPLGGPGLPSVTPVGGQ